MSSNEYVLIVNLRRLPRENIETFLAARALGVRVALIAPTLPQTYATYVDAFYPCDTLNADAVMQEARRVFEEREIRGVLPSSETNVALASRIADHYSLPGMPLEAIGNARNKNSMRNTGRNHPAIALRHEVFTDPNDAWSVLERVGFPAIVKPSAGAGSVGIFTIRSREDIPYFLRHAEAIGTGLASVDARREFIAEEFIEGREVSIDGVISNGEITIYGIADKWNTPDHHLEVSGVFPSRMSRTRWQETMDSVASIVRQFGFDNCTFHMEGKVAENGFKLLEVGARPGGDYWLSHTIRMVTGINGYEEAIKVCMGIPTKPEVNCRCVAAMRYLMAEKEGVLRGYKNWEQTLAIPELEYAFPEVAIGSSVQLPPRSYRTSKLINFIGRSSDYERLSVAMEEVVRTIEPIIE